MVGGDEIHNEIALIEAVELDGCFGRQGRRGRQFVAEEATLVTCAPRAARLHPRPAGLDPLTIDVVRAST